MPYRKIKVAVRWRGKKKESPIVDNAGAAATVARKITGISSLLWRENVLQLCLNKHNRLLGWYRVGIGGMDSAIVDIGIIASVALLSRARKIILIHNHPDGDLHPSAADIQLTDALKAALRLLRIDLSDHVIVTDSGHLSMKENGYL